MIDKLIMINVTTHKYPYGTILSVIKEHKNQSGYIAEVAEKGNRVYVAKDVVKEL